MKSRTRIDQVVEQVRTKIGSGQYAAHERIPSEVKLQEEYGVSGDTVRKALSRLVTEGAIYRLPWKGTFVSPKAKVGRILVVTHFATAAQADNYGLVYGFPLFEHGLRCYEHRHELPYVLVPMERDTYQRCAHEVHLIHKDLAGIIFFRDIESCLSTRVQLDELGIPFVFYGSDRLHSQLPDENTYCYEAETLVHAALEYLAGKGHTKILCTLGEGIFAKAGRYRIYEAWMRKQGLWSDELVPVVMEDGVLKSDPRELICHGTAVLGTTDREAVSVLNATVRAGISVPGTLAVMGIDNYPVGLSTIVPLTSVDIPLTEDAERCLKLFVELLAGKRRIINERSTVHVVVRESA